MNSTTKALRGFGLAALLAASISASAQTGGLDPATLARVDKTVETIRQADALRKSVFLTYGSSQADRYMALQEFRDTRRAATLDAAEALLAVRGSFPKEQWKTLVEHLSGGGSLPLLVEKAQRELSAIVTDPTRLKGAEKSLKELADAVEKNAKDRESARKKFWKLLEKESSTRDDFVSGLQDFDKAQAKLDDKFAASVSALQQALTPAEWDQLVRRISQAPAEGAAGK